MNLKFVAATLLAAVIVTPVNAEEKAAKKNRGQRNQQNAATLLMKQLEPVKLTEDQISKATELGKAASAKMKEIRDDAGITRELMKKRQEAQKSLKDSGKKGKELAAAINKAAGYSEEQLAALKKVTEIRLAFRNKVLAMLSDDQKENLPEQLKKSPRSGNRGKGKGKGKKKDAS